MSTKKQDLTCEQKYYKTQYKQVKFRIFFMPQSTGFAVTNFDTFLPHLLKIMTKLILKFDFESLSSVIN